MIDRIQTDALRQLYTHWDEQRAGRTMPSPKGIDPAAIPNVLPYVMLLDVERGPMRFHYRLVGTSVVQGFGEEITGRYLDELDLGELGLQNIAMMSDVADNGHISYHCGEFEKRDGRRMRQERIAMPLSTDGTTVDMILVGLNWMRLEAHDRTPLYPEEGVSLATAAEQSQA